MHEESFGDPIADVDEVDDVLRAAQRAVLTGQGNFAEGGDVNDGMPVSPPNMRSNMTSQASRGQYRGMQPLPFSRNVVCVDVTGPDLADLAFVDLPGE